MTQVAQPNGLGYGQDLTFYPDTAPSWLGLKNQYFNIGVQCSNNYTMFFTHSDIDKGEKSDLDPKQGCSIYDNIFQISFVKTVQGGYK